MTDLALTVLVPQGEVLKNSPIKNSQTDAKMACTFCHWTVTVRFNARLVRIMADQHFKRSTDERLVSSRLCKKRS